MTGESLETFFKLIDMNGDGQVTIEEFLRVIHPPSFRILLTCLHRQAINDPDLEEMCPSVDGLSFQI